MSGEDLMRLAERAEDARVAFARRAQRWGVVNVLPHPTKPGKGILIRAERRPMPHAVGMALSASWLTFKRADAEYEAACRESWVPFL